jgi:fatty-acyl-CoA synthase
VIGLPDDKWRARVVAVLQTQPGSTLNVNELRQFVKSEVGSVKTPKQMKVWPGLPRSSVGKVPEKDIRAALLRAQQQPQLQPA